MTAINMTGKLRIIGGQWRGRKLAVPDRPGLRPTGDRARETLFNWLGPRVIGASVLDLFAGSGALGLEAASRGATRVVLIEHDRAAAEALRSGPLSWPGAGLIELVQTDALAWLGHGAGPFDLVLIDPPFDSGLLEPALLGLFARPELLSPNARLYVESAPGQVPEVWPCSLELLRQKQQGQVVLSLLRRRGAEQ